MPMFKGATVINLPRDRKVQTALFVLGEALAVLGNEVADLERHLLERRPKDQPAEPTWTNSKGETFRLSEMPTTYLANVARGLRRRGMAGDEHFGGIYSAIVTELQKREAVA